MKTTASIKAAAQAAVERIRRDAAERLTYLVKKITDDDTGILILDRLEKRTFVSIPVTMMGAEDEEPRMIPLPVKRILYDGSVELRDDFDGTIERSFKDIELADVFTILELLESILSQHRQVVKDRNGYFVFD